MRIEELLFQKLQFHLREVRRFREILEKFDGKIQQIPENKSKKNLEKRNKLKGVMSIGDCDRTAQMVEVPKF